MIQDNQRATPPQSIMIKLPFSTADHMAPEQRNAHSDVREACIFNTACFSVGGSAPPPLSNRMLLKRAP